MSSLVHPREIGIQPQPLNPMFNKLIAALAIASVGFSAMPAKANVEAINEQYASGIMYGAVCMHQMGIITEEGGNRQIKRLLAKKGISHAIVSRQSVMDMTMAKYEESKCADIVDMVYEVKNQKATRI